MSAANDKLTDTTGIRITDAFVVIIKTEWNSDVVSALESGCIELLAEHSISFRVLEVPGAFEIPYAVQQYWASASGRKPDAFITLGCVIRGDTPHFDYVCAGVTQALSQLNINLPVPVIFGVLTVNNREQADERTGGIHGHKGRECAVAAMKMIALAQSLQK